MPEFLEDPSVLTKEKLKSELVANNVTLPAGEQRKDVYVQLYLQHLTARNRLPLAAGANSKGPPDFSSDEEREPTPVLGSGAAAAGRSRASVGRKATKKTDKPRQEDKDDVDVTELTNEDLLDQLVKYGVNPGPIVGTTRKLYEKKLLKLREQGTESRSSTPLPTISSSAENTRQNGSNDSDRYSDNEEGKKKEHKKVKSTRDFVPFSELPTTPSGGFFQDPKIELKLEKREPLKGRAKTSVTLKQRRVEQNQVDTSEHFRIDGAIISESTPIAETIMASSNETLVVNRVTGNFKHAAPILPITEFSDIPRRTPKKPLTRAEVGEKEERRLERDILKEMFPFEASTPTGISASCRRPIKGAAGRPLELSDFRMEESYSSKYIPKYVPLADVKSEKTKKGRFIPMWIKILLFVVMAIFLFLVYQAMETNQRNPFSKFLSDGPRNAN
ncbi:PREDICTED: thymopoietin isoform X4 [Hipposideros armiger]|uniref:Thymopoietin isoform X4 n=1 Tax=Hipposideros armiger TaxID=186990 RepID=A0A8B7R844_HIPAR|nr:PREDICTED: thymopoietin isoform X4 [Hipposideros armiger]